MLRTPKDVKKKPYIAQRHAVRQEERVAKDIGGKLIKGSGCGTTRGDSRKDKIIRIENKATTKKSFRLTTEIVEKIENAALAAGEIPAIQIEFINLKGTIEHSICIVPTYILNFLIESRKDGNA